MSARGPDEVTGIGVENAAQLELWARLGSWEPRAVCFTPDGAVLLVASSVGVQIYALPGLDRQQTVAGEGEPLALAVRPDGRVFACLERAGERTLVRLLDRERFTLLGLRALDAPGLAGTPGPVLSGTPGPGPHPRIAFGRGGRRLVVSGARGHVWELGEGELGGGFSATAPLVCGAPVALGRATALRAMGTEPGVVEVWDDASRQRLSRFETGCSEILALAFCDHDRQLAVTGLVRAVVPGSAAKLSVWEVTTGKPTARCALPSVPRELACTPDGTACLVGGGATGALLVRLPVEGARLPSTSVAALPSEATALRSIDVTAAGDRVAAVFESDGSVRTWALPVSPGPFADAQVGACLAPPRLGVVERLVFRGDELWARCARVRGLTEGQTLAWDLHGGAPLPDATTAASPLPPDARSPDGTLRAESVLTGRSGPRVLGDREEVQADVRVVRCDDGVQHARVPGRASAVGWHFSPGGSQLLVRYEDGTARLWDLVAQKTVRTFGGWPMPRGAAASALGERPSFSDDGSVLAWSCLDGSGERHARLWRTVGGDELGRLPAAGETLAVHPPSGLVASGDARGELELWHLASGARLWSRRAHLRPIVCLAIAPDATRLASAASDGSIAVWSLVAPPRAIGPPSHRQLPPMPAFDAPLAPASGGGIRVVRRLEAERGLWEAERTPVVAERIPMDVERALWESERTPVVAERTPKGVQAAEPLPVPPNPRTSTGSGCSGSLHVVDAAIAANRADAPDDAGRTPLFGAVAPFAGCRECVRRLVGAGADVNRRAADGHSVVDALYAGVTSAIEYEDAHVVEALLREAGYRGQIWVFERHERVAAELRDAGVRWTRSVAVRPGDTGGVPSSVAVTPAAETRIVDQSLGGLRRDGPPFAVPPSLVTALAEASGEPTPFAAEPLAPDVRRLLAWSRRGDTAAVEALLRDGVPADACDGHGYTALHAALGGRQGDTALALLAAGAPAGGVDPRAAPPLATAAALSLPRLVLALLEAGASVDAPDPDGRTPLACALRAEQPSREVVEWLLAAGADPNRADACGQAPLMHAKSEAIVELLLGAGANPDARDSTGRSALAVQAGEPESSDLVARLLRAGASADVPDAYGARPLHLAAEVGAEQNLKLLLAAGAEVDAADHEGRTPLLRAIGGRPPKVAVIEALLAAGADPARRDAQGLSPLLVAADRSRVELLAPLVAAGADVDARDAEGRTAFMRAARGGSRAVLVALHRLDADVSLRDGEGRSAADLASAALGSLVDTLNSTHR